MKQKKVYMLAGIPGAGKSSWCRARMALGCEWISRDKVRFSILDKTDAYFAKEDDVFDTFINYINQTLENENIHTVFIDATHITQKSRNKVLRRIHHKENISELNCVYFDVPVAVCHSRNNLREGRAKVPASVIDHMAFDFQIPNKNFEKFDHIFVVDENGDTKEV